jgi:hypothetical protein
MPNVVLNLPQVTLREATDRGRLYLYPDPEVEHDLFDIRTKPKRSGIYNFNVASCVLFSIDRERLPVHVEFVIPRRAWKRQASLVKPQAVRVADIVFAEASIETQYVEPPVSVITNNELSTALVLFGDPVASQNWIGLSGNCFALVDGTSLLGFYIDFASA